MNESQTKLVEMLSFFHKLCVDNNLRYYIVEGSFLGAVRHKGFIPWDDDIDVALPRNDYEKLITIFKDNHSKYQLETPGINRDFIYTYSKLYDTETTLIEKSRYNLKRGIYLDIFPLDGAGDSLPEAIKHCKKITNFDNYICTKTCALNPNRKFYKNIAILIGRCIPEFIFGWRWAQRKALNLCKQKSFDDCKYVCNMFSTWREKEIMEIEVYGTPTLYNFEGIEIYGPQNSDKYLSSLYGDYMTLPPEEKRISHHQLSLYELK